MRRRALSIALGLMALAAGLWPASSQAQPRSVVDSAGRRVESPATIDRVLAAGPPASGLLYALMSLDAAVSISGIIGWIGLLVPHLARTLTGPDFARLLPAALMLGAGCLVGVDALARSLAAIEIPLGILTAALCRRLIAPSRACR